MTNFISAVDGSLANVEIVFIALACVFTFATILLAIWLLTKFIRKPSYASVIAKNEEAGIPIENKFNFKGMLIAVALIAFIVRVLIGIFVTGYREDFMALYTMATTTDLSSYINSSTITSYPIVAYIYYIFGSVIRVMGIGYDDVLTQIIIKLPLIIADVVTICVMYKLACKFTNEYVGLVIAGFLAVFMPMIMMSSMWTSSISITTMLLCVAFYFVASKNFIGLTVSYMFALLSGQIALFLFPVLAVYTIFNFVKSAKYVRNNGFEGFVGTLKSDGAKNLFLIPICMFGAFVCMYLVTLPLSTGYLYNPFTWLSTFLIAPLSQVAVFGNDGLNIFNLFLRNGVSLGVDFPTGVFAFAFVVIILILTMVVYLSRKNRANLVFLAGYVLLTLNTYYIGATAVTLLPSLVLFVMALLVVRDKRILTIIGVLSICMTFNSVLVLAGAGYLNTLEYSEVSSAVVAVLGEGGYLVANIVLSVFTVLAHIYATIVALDISMSGNRKPFTTKEGDSFGASLVSFLR